MASRKVSDGASAPLFSCSRSARCSAAAAANATLAASPSSCEGSLPALPSSRLHTFGSQQQRDHKWKDPYDFGCSRYTKCDMHLQPMHLQYERTSWLSDEDCTASTDADRRLAIVSAVDSSTSRAWSCYGKNRQAKLPD